MIRACCRLMVLGCGAVGVTIVAAAFALADGPPDGDGQHGGQRPVYQRQAFDWRSKDHDRRRDGFDKFGRRMTPQVSSGWFQRPYPYHLDYYKMRYGGSYAPYFGNLYGTPFGTPQVVYGGWGLGAGGWGSESIPYGQGFYGGQPNGFQGVPYSNSMMPEGAAAGTAPANGQTAPPKDESLPAPTP